MGIFDQNKQWKFTVRAPEKACIAAFRSAFGNGGLLRSAEWSFQSGDDAVNGHHHMAIFQGRTGLGGFVNSLSKRGSEQSRAALGSTIAFATNESADSTECSMWLKLTSTQLGFKNEASLLRHYMRSVEAELLKVDPHLQLSKS